ncbi:response regulator transcription factor [Salinimicrobium sp. GXAS 041]|uniref:response regulator transcription factor n=1 Tax=Salinimicrobium sp. GXAS 041 TaxID=3400806 RepID=UPI003C74CBB2
MEKKQLLLISNNNDFLEGVKSGAGFSFEVTSVKNIHAGYTLALAYLPDVILVDYTSMDQESAKNLQNFKSTHFLNKSILFLYAKTGQKSSLECLLKDAVDHIIYNCSYVDICNQIEDVVSLKRSLTNYWKDSFLGLFNLLSQPVVLLQNEAIIAMNDAFKKYFFVNNPTEINLIDFVDCRNKYKVLETLKNFVRGKHMKATTTTSLRLMNNKVREAKVTFSKLDKNLSGQLLLIIDFAENGIPLNEEIGTSSRETENYFAQNNSAEAFNFTQREKEIIELLCKGYKTKEISEALCISAKTIEKHRSNIIKRTNSDTILESIVYALNHKLIDI